MQIMALVKAGKDAEAQAEIDTNTFLTITLASCLFKIESPCFAESIIYRISPDCKEKYLDFQKIHFFTLSQSTHLCRPTV